MRRATKATKVWRVAVRLCAALALLMALAVVPAWATYNADDHVFVVSILSPDTVPSNDVGWSNLGVGWSGIETDLNRRVVSLDVGWGKIVSEDLDLSDLDKLTYLSCEGNQLKSLNASRLAELTYLDCWGNELESLDVSGLTKLTWLGCNANELTALDVSGLAALTGLNCSYNELTALDVSGLTGLTELYCNYNQLTTLDVSGLTKVTRLYCYNNKLTALDVSGLTELTYLRCSDNQLTTLDVSGLTELTELYCDNNQLTLLDLSELGQLTYLQCYNNRPVGSVEPGLGIVMSMDRTLWVNPDLGYPSTAEWELVPGTPTDIVEVSLDNKLTLTVVDVGDPVTLSADVPEHGNPGDNDYVPGHTFTLTVYTSNIEAERAMAVFNASGAFKGKGEISSPAVSPDVLEAITSAVAAVDAASMAELIPIGAFTAKPSPTAALSADVSIIMPSFNVTVPLKQGNVMPMAFTVYASAMPSGWAAMTPAQRIELLTSGDNGVRTVFAYEYVPGANEAAQPPVDLIGGGDPLLTWAEAYDDGIVTFNASGDMTITYIATTGTEPPFVAGEFIVIPDGEPYPGQITDPAWLLLKPKTASDPDDPHKSSGGVGCATGAGAFALLTLGIALLKKRR